MFVFLCESMRMLIANKNEETKFVKWMFNKNTFLNSLCIVHLKKINVTFFIWLLIWTHFAIYTK